jgi:hypothetical protein
MPCERSLSDLHIGQGSSIRSFFSAQQVDVPICFKKSRSLYMTSFEIPIIKFNNMLMRSGKKNQSLKILTQSLLNIDQAVLKNTLPFQGSNILDMYSMVDALHISSTFN